MSYMYSILNYIAATSKETIDGASSHASTITEVTDISTLHSVEIGLRGLSEDERRTVGISSISIATRLALEFRSEEVRTILGCVMKLLSVSAGDAAHGIDALATTAHSRADC